MALKDLLQQVCQPLRRWLVWRQHKEIADGDSRNGAASLPSDSQVSRFGVSVFMPGGTITNLNTGLSVMVMSKSQPIYYPFW